VTGTIGPLAIILAFIGSQSLPLNVAGLLLIGLAMILFVLEVSVVSHGLLTVGGLVCLALGLSALYTAPVGPTGPDVTVAWPVIATVTATIGIIASLMIITAIRTRSMPGTAGTVGVPVAVGTEGTVRTRLEPSGTVYLAGETWTARAENEAEPIEPDAAVRLIGFDGLTAIVEPSAPEGAIPQPPSASPSGAPTGDPA